MTTMTPGMQAVMGKLVGRALQARQRNDGVPFVLALFATHHCMCSCKSCLWKHNDWDDTSLDDLKRLYAEAAELGFVATAISGGEPFMRRDLGELVRYVKQELGLAILLFTTGWYLKSRMDDVLPHVDMLMLSLDSARAERHDAIRGLPGLFDRLMASIDQVKARYPELSMQFNTCIQRGVADEIDELIALADSKGMPISFDVITEARNGADGAAFTKTDMGMSLPELQKVCRGLLERKRSGAPILNSERYFEYFANGRRGYRCHFPKLALVVDGRGKVEDCLDLDNPIADIRASSLREIMERPRFKQLRADAERCSTCSSPTMVDLSHVWDDPQLVFRDGGLALG